MMTFKKGCAVAALALALPMAAMSSGNAAPLAPASVLATSAAGANNSNPLLTEVQWRRVGRYHGGWRGGYRRGGWGGAGLGVGLAAGALLGGAIAAGAANGPYYGPGYYSEPVVVEPGYAGGDAVSYCMQRFKSYDPGSGTYLGYDGLRHPYP
jgi:BA14K-like protein